MNIEAVAVETLKCAMTWAPDARLVGNVRASDIAALAAAAINTCPKCGATAWVNIDCPLCGICHALLHDEPANTSSTTAKEGA